MFVISAGASTANKIRTPIYVTIQYNKNFSNICDLFVDNKLKIHCRKEKAKSILFSIKKKKKAVETLNISNGNIKIKQ